MALILAGIESDKVLVYSSVIYSRFIFCHKEKHTHFTCKNYSQLVLHNARKGLCTQNEFKKTKFIIILNH